MDVNQFNSAFACFDPDEHCTRQRKNSSRRSNRRRSGSRRARYAHTANGSIRATRFSSSDQDNLDSNDTSPTQPTKPAFDRIVQLCTLRDRSCFELRERLKRDGYDTEDIEAALARCCACGLVDDIRFAESYIRAHVAQGKGSRTIAQFLAMQDIAVESLKGWPDAFGLSSEDQMKRAYQLLCTRPPHARDMRQAAWRKLISRGFPPDAAARAVRQWANEALYSESSNSVTSSN
ncbi:regulatory protein RecX [Cryptobacterium curtum]|uniref:regulatory protein RecX n=1 Tax=Cryptobacterium curtum TaxID=84163 RepID=UPI00248D8BB4|nr:regulatory protein RecX [Cryptobacterium curtum]